ncbi:hypothetical protein OUZ56_023032 [Daphnia magna]|uniref:Uncharacterized protein n=1 Tax=Daphnia magna TaxID=35525 RepID=A0ABR0AYF3_9CRUS|nr:hypothetical protein OUZ56_023032 [Daphnia magna]
MAIITNSLMRCCWNIVNSFSQCSRGVRGHRDFSFLYQYARGFQCLQCSIQLNRDIFASAFRIEVVRKISVIQFESNLRQ